MQSGTQASSVWQSCVVCAGVVLNMAGLVLFGVSSSSGVNAFIPAAILLGLGNITFHLAQFHISALFPRSRGLVASIFVAGFTGCGIIMYLLTLVFESTGASRWVECQNVPCYRHIPWAPSEAPPALQGFLPHHHAVLCWHLLSLDSPAGLDDA